MKKSSVIGLLIVSLALFATSLTSCVTHHNGEDYVYAAQKIWLLGDADYIDNVSWNKDDEKLFELKKEASSFIFKGEFEAKKTGTPHLKLLIDQRSWDNTFSAGGKTSALDKEVTFDQRNKDADTYPLTKDKKYKITVDGTVGNALKVTITES